MVVLNFRARQEDTQPQLALEITDPAVLHLLEAVGEHERIEFILCALKAGVNALSSHSPTVQIIQRGWQQQGD